MKKDIVAGTLTLLIVVLFWSRRDYSSPLSGMFVDPLLVALAVLGLFLLSRALYVLRSERGGTARGQGAEEALRPMRAGLVIAIMVAWVLAVEPLGFALSGVLFFFGLTRLMRNESGGWRGVVVDSGAALGTVLVLYVVFTEFLEVRLPGGLLG